jgi:CDP-paratose 2-epimerase
MDGMGVAVVTGSCGLVGSEAVWWFLKQGYRVIGIDNNMRERFFGKAGSTIRVREQLLELENYTHLDDDISGKSMQRLFSVLDSSVEVVIHAAAQPSHDWAATNPLLDFRVNAWGTLNLLEAVRNHCPEAVFVFVSTNKVYGDTPNRFEYTEEPLRRVPVGWGSDWQSDGFDETLPIDQSMHSLFGASKLAADILVQEYGRYFGLKTGCFRCGCITGSQHAGVEVHGFLSYLMRCVVEGRTYTIYGYKGKQVRDNIHAYDLIKAFWWFVKDPGHGEVFNMGGGRKRSCSVLEAIELCKEVSIPLNTLEVQYVDKPRRGDHIWWITDTGKFEARYPQWMQAFTLEMILEDLYGAQAKRSAA